MALEMAARTAADKLALLRDKLRPQFIGGKAPVQQADVSRPQVRQMGQHQIPLALFPGDEQRVQDQAVEHIGQRRQARLGMPARGPGLVGALDPAEFPPQRGVWRAGEPANCQSRSGAGPATGAPRNHFGPRRPRSRMARSLSSTKAVCLSLRRASHQEAGATAGSRPAPPENRANAVAPNGRSSCSSNTSTMGKVSFLRRVKWCACARWAWQNFRSG